ncbi:YncE family protein [Planctomycetota bacterium]
MSRIWRTAAAIGLVLAYSAAVRVGEGAEASRKFSTPVSDPGARWVKEVLVHVKNCGDPLDGPSTGMQTNCQPSVGTYFEGGGDWYMRRYDPKLDRYFTVAGDAAGYLDGPISRARFGLSGYAKERAGGRSPDGRYQYFTEPCLGGALRCIDWEKGEVKTILKKVGGSPGMTVDTKGTLYIVSYGGFQIVAPDGTAQEKKLEFRKGTQGYAMNLVIDEKNNRLYAARRDTHVWYWDLSAGGKYVEVLNSETSKAEARKLCATGPFDGMRLHCPAGLVKGPGDLGVGYLYFGGGDDKSFYRLDLAKQYMLRFRPMESDKKLFHFGESPGKVGAAINGWCGPPGGWDENGDFYLGDWAGGSAGLYRYKRVQ